ncbi:PulJ/GspJ family protein [Bradyrhizobium sp. SYSU BS000235]|uniref:PulJ/GspJ family protein n=1 Tax=Bradyrhizobium sp. SYSU BS000235 TaxID=3411332 RepID=UPI003C777D58
MARQRENERGFTLIETLVALALTGMVLSALASITAQWLPNWNRGIDRIQRSETIGIALQRIAADLASAEYVSPDRDKKRPLFDGSELSVTFVRTALGPNVGTGLDIVRLGEASDHGDLVTVRSRASFRPLQPGSSVTEQLHFSDQVLLLRPPYRLSFAYAGQDMVWRASWRDADQLPTAIKLTVRDAATERILSVSTVTPIHVQVSAECMQSPKECSKKADETRDHQNSGQSNAPGSGGGAL